MVVDMVPEAETLPVAANTNGTMVEDIVPVVATLPVAANMNGAIVASIVPVGVALSSSVLLANGAPSKNVRAAPLMRLSPRSKNT
jgi:hypothetical protein